MRTTWTLIAWLLVPFASCTRSHDCRDGTVFVTLNLGELAASTQTIQIDMVFDGGGTETAQPDPPPNGRPYKPVEQFQAWFPPGPTPKQVAITAVARSAQQQVLGQATQSAAIHGSCVAVTLDFAAAGSSAGLGGAGGASAGGAGLGGAGAPGSCTDECAPAPAVCANGGFSACLLGANGCYRLSNTDCGSYPGVCERNEGPLCASAEWAEWPPPDTAADVGSTHVENYTDNNDGTVTDNVTKLIWEKLPADAKYAWPLANDHCQGLSLAGFTDWRLPSQIELLSIVDYGIEDPSINSQFFPSTFVDSYWSATPKLDGGAGFYWFVNFDMGLTTGDNQDNQTTRNDGSNQYRARCVR